MVLIQKLFFMHMTKYTRAPSGRYLHLLKRELFHKVGQTGVCKIYFWWVCLTTSCKFTSRVLDVWPLRINKVKQNATPWLLYDHVIDHLKCAANGLLHEMHYCNLIAQLSNVSANLEIIKQANSLIKQPDEPIGN